jgi:hypothetical protein
MTNTASKLTQSVVNWIEKLEPINEITADGKPYRTLTCPVTADVVGDIKVYRGTNIIDYVVVVHIIKDSMQMDAYMVSAFTKADSLYPHLVFDCELLPDDSAFHIDMLHKVDNSIDTSYIKTILEPLTEPFNAANNNENFRFSDATLLMKTLLNPWMASYHCLPKHLPQAQQTIDAYTQQWLNYKQDNMDILSITDNEKESTRNYDLARRKALFNPDVDILWDMLPNMIGLESRDLILDLLRGAEV